METNSEKDVRKCIKCKKTLVGKSIFSLCPKCINDYSLKGSGLFTIGIVGRSLLLKHGGKIVKGAFNLIKVIKG